MFCNQSPEILMRLFWRLTTARDERKFDLGLEIVTVITISAFTVE